MTKMKWFLLCNVWTLSNFVIVKSNFTFTYDMAMHCKQHLAQRGYSYDTFYRLDSEDLRKIKKDPDILLEMHLAILAGSNGHILLSTVPHPVSADPVYEIVVGGGGNKFTELRRNLRRNARASARTYGILSSIELRAFYIKITEDGMIVFGREGEELPVLTYQDVNPLTINYFSFAAWNGVEAKFLYDCPKPGDVNNEVSPNSEPVEEQLSNTDSLKRFLLLNRDPTIPPANKITVQLAVQINSVVYDALDSKLTTSLSIVMNWMDNSMAWNPDKFNNTAVLTFRQGQIWSPKFFIINSDSSSMLNSRNPESILMQNSGLSTYHFQTQVVTWCFDGTSTMNRWPRDEYICELHIEPWEIHENIALEKFSPDDPALNLFADIDNVVENGWDVTVEETFYVNATSWTDYYLVNYNHTKQSDKCVVSLYLKRQATTYNIVFYMPLIVIMVYVLMSFWTDTLTSTRVWFYTGCSIVICMGFSFIDYLVPCHTVPSILYLYTAVLGGVLLALLTQVILMTSLASQLCKSTFVHGILMLQCCRNLFCLPVLKTCQIYESINEVYSTTEEDDSQPVEPRNGTIEEMQSEVTEYSETKEIAEIIDKIMFFTYSIVFAVLLGLHF